MLNKIKIGFVALALMAGSMASADNKANMDSSDKTSRVSASVPSPSSDTGTVFLSVGSGLALYNGNTGWAINAGGLTQVADDLPLFVGADLALNFWGMNSVTGSPISAGTTGIQLLPTAIYRFDVEALGPVRPYIGLSMGPNVMVTRREEVVGGLVQKTSDTTVAFEILARPGIFLALTDAVALNFETKLGVLRSDFIFLPSANVSFRL